MRQNLRMSLIAIAFVLSTAPVMHAADFSFTQIMVPGASVTQALGINGAGNIVGQYSDTTGGHGFLDVNGSFTPINVNFPGVTATLAQGINGAGNIVGNYGHNGLSHGFLDVGGIFTSIDYPGAITTYAAGINGSGDIVGPFVGHSQGANGIFGFLATPAPEPSSFRSSASVC